jgi:hypothetical protein
MVENNNDFAASVMTLILYQLAEEKEPFLQLELLRGLTKMAVQKVNIIFLKNYDPNWHSVMITVLVSLREVGRLWASEHIGLNLT